MTPVVESHGESCIRNLWHHVETVAYMQVMPFDGRRPIGQAPINRDVRDVIWNEEVTHVSECSAWTQRDGTRQHHAQKP